MIGFSLAASAGFFRYRLFSQIGMSCPISRLTEFDERPSDARSMLVTVRVPQREEKRDLCPLVIDRSRAPDEARVDQPLVARDREPWTAPDHVDPSVNGTLRRWELLGRQHHTVVPVKLDLLRRPNLRVGMDELKMGLVEPVLTDLLHARPDRVLEDLIFAVVRVVVLGDFHDVPKRHLLRGWYHASTMPLRSTVGKVRRCAFGFGLSAYGISTFAPVAS